MLTKPNQGFPRVPWIAWLAVLSTARFILHASDESVAVGGELQQWHRVSLTFQGPATDETAPANPFRNYRLNVMFSKGKSHSLVPGFFAADGDAAESGAMHGSKWRVNFAPPEPGLWNYSASFREGPDVAIDTDPAAGKPAAFDGVHGSFSVEPAGKPDRDFRTKGFLKYVGTNYLRFAGSGEWFIKGGADSPETFLQFAGFDGASKNAKRYRAHENDWHEGDPSWHGAAGRNIIGALNYLSGKGMNSVYFLTFSIHPGDKKDGNGIGPWISQEAKDFDRYDCSKLDQWEIVFSHMDRLGILLHVVLQERQNDQMLDGGEVGVQRKLYLRELIARFAHHPAIQWNIGEENGAVAAGWTNEAKDMPGFPMKSEEQLTEIRKSTAHWIRLLDAYSHPIVCHAHPRQKQAMFSALLGFGEFDGPSLQHPNQPEIVKWIDASNKAGHPWIVCLDESANSDPMPPGGPRKNGGSTGVAPDSFAPEHDGPRKKDLWPTLIAGGAGVEWYFGHQFPENDSSCEDWHTRERMWDQTRYALEFFHANLPFTKMHHADQLLKPAGNYCFALPGEVYAIYIPDGGEVDLDLGKSEGKLSVRWFNPRTGGALQEGAIREIRGPGYQALGSPPTEPDRDWVVLVKR